MIKPVLLFVLLISSFKLFAQKILYEQRSVNFFFDSIFRLTYINDKVVEFSGYTQNDLSDFQLFKNCFTEKDSLQIKLRQKTVNKTFNKKSINTTEITNILFKKVKMKSSKRLKLLVWQVNELDEKFYVLIEIIKQYHFTNAYMFELGEDGEIISWCKTGVIL